MNRLLEIARFLGIDIPVIASQLGVTKELLYMITKGKRNISKKLANKIQSVYGIPYDYSSFGEGELKVDESLIVNDMAKPKTSDMTEATKTIYENYIKNLEDQLAEVKRENAELRGVKPKANAS